MDNNPPDGGAPAFRSLEPDALPVWLDNAGYETGYVGKYLNYYDGTYVPSGWDEWKGRVVGLPYVGKDQVEGFGMDGKNAEGKTHTEVFSEEAGSFVRQRAGSSAPPFFLFVSPYAPHDPGVHADSFDTHFSGAKLPRPPSFNEQDVSDKPAWIRNDPRLTREKVAEAQRLYRNRLRSMKDVDSMVGKLVGTLRETGELDNTYVVFASDNGYHAGQHRLLMPPKRLAYEEDIRVPLIVRGPGVPDGATRSGTVLNNDLAPTLAGWVRRDPAATARWALAGAAARGNAAGPLEDGIAGGGRPARADRAPRLPGRQDAELPLRLLRQRGEGALQPRTRPLRAQRATTLARVTPSRTDCKGGSPPWPAARGRSVGRRRDSNRRTPLLLPRDPTPPGWVEIRKSHGGRPPRGSTGVSDLHRCATVVYYRLAQVVPPYYG